MAQSPYLDQNAPEILALERQKKLADLLQSRALEQPQGQMVSGRYVAPSIIQQLAPLANAYMGRKAGEDVESRQAKLANLIRGQNVAETKDILETMQGREGVAGNLPLEGTNQAIGSLEEPMGDYVAPKAAVAPDKMAALMKALNAQGAGGQALAPQLMSSMFKEETPLILPEGGTAINRLGKVIARGAPKEDKPPVSFQEFKLAQQDGFKGTYQQYQDLDANRKRPLTTVTVNSEQKTFDNTQKLRGEFRAEPIYKAQQEVQSAFNQVKEGLDAKSPAGDLAAATKFMKLLDPGSVVRESELALAMQAGGALDRLTSYASNIANGTKLTDKQRTDFKDLSTKFFNTSAQLFNEKQKEYTDIANRYNFNPKDVAGEPVKLQGGKPNNAITATNQQTGEKLMSTDGGKTWKPMGGQ
jgi:hypothetical protein